MKVDVIRTCYITLNVRVNPQKCTKNIINTQRISMYLLET